eukprot:TRINITY_DN2670_c4_g1_i4.p1 TRINITY_DN2670_c4_g1~~TRINITY_DN2670_c4_g1_i4.p1  ORF type:complete len:371 (-),score=47.58 TRINITY_DN2670_c4_g1_i4:289-1401(-)
MKEYRDYNFSSTEYTSSNSLMDVNSIDYEKNKVHYQRAGIMISGAFFFIFLSLFTCQNLETSLIPDQKLAFFALMFSYISIAVSTLFISPLLSGLIETKLTMILASLGYAAFIFINLIPRYETLIPLSCLLGFSASLLWSAEGTYLTSCALYHAKYNNLDGKATITSFTGNFFLFLTLSVSVGNLIASLTLIYFKTNGAKILYIFLGSVSLLGTLFLILLPKIDLKILNKKKTSNFEKFQSSFKLLTNPKMLLLCIPIMFIGLENGFIYGSYTGNIVSTVLTAKYTGFVMIPFGVSDAIFCYIFGRLAPKIGSRGVIFISATMFLSFIIFYLTLVAKYGLDWIKDYSFIFYISSAVWGIGDSGFITICNR